jgi:hypothetical protein
MELLDVEGNTLTSTLPPSYAAFTAVKDVMLANNRLTGTLPPDWQGLGALDILTLSNNSLQGTLPASWSNLASLGLIALGRNNFTGTVPKDWLTGNDGSVVVELQGNKGLKGCLPRGWDNKVVFITAQTSSATFNLSALGASSQGVLLVSSVLLPGQLDRAVKEGMSGTGITKLC